MYRGKDYPINATNELLNFDWISILNNLDCAVGIVYLIKKKLLFYFIDDMKKKRDLQSIIKEASYEPIQYSIHDYSSHSGTYYPQNITVNNPTEQSSRWSSGSHDQSQYITLKLEKPVIACNYKHI